MVFLFTAILPVARGRGEGRWDEKEEFIVR